MKDNLVVGLMALGVVLATAGIVAVVREKVDQPPEVNCTVLDSDPDFFAGRTVRLRTGGMQPTDNRSEFVYRKFADKPPVVLVRFDSPPERLPPVVVGFCEGRVGTAVLLTHCKPAP